MLLTSCGQHFKVMRSLRYVLLLNAALLLKLTEALSEGDACIMKSVSGVCTSTDKCTSLEAAIQRREINVSDIVSCGFDLQEEVICCPTNGQATTNPTNPTKTTVAFNTTTPATSTTSPTTDSSTMTTVTTPKYERPAVRACRLIEADLKPIWTSYVLGGKPVKLGEFQHMVAIGYSNIGNDAGYDFRCGGSLIDKKFVLTAAHCVSSRISQPSIVRMGVTNFTDVEQMRNVVEIKIKKVHIHPEFTSRYKYNDIAILELERGVDYSDTIHATCLYTELTDPPSESDLHVTGWGKDETLRLSKHLLKAKLQIISVGSCNQSFVGDDGRHTRHLPHGVDNTQLCAFDPDVKKDACEGDSGGPLNLVLHENPKKYRVVGIISSGFPCGTAAPGLYTRVANFLDYIEDLVWPSSK